jgi:hypothetical protein
VGGLRRRILSLVRPLHGPARRILRRVAVVYGEGTKAGVYIQATLFTRDPVIPPITA